MDFDRFWILVSRSLAGESSQEEEEELKSMVEKSMPHRLRYEAILKHWGKSKQRADIDIENAYQRVREVISGIEQGTSRNLYPTNNIVSWVARIAAVLTIAIGIGMYLNAYQETIWVKLAWHSKENAKGERSKITLPDGSTVWLNADSELRYPEEFSADAREIFLTGEAFFDVTKNPKKPFIIHLADGQVRVLGTTFNVKAFDGDSLVETSVVTGKVAFIPNTTAGHLQDTMLLTPDHKAVYSRTFKKLSMEKTNGSEEKAWTEGRLIFRSARFDEVAKTLERTYARKITFAADDLRNCRLTGTFQSNSLEEVIALISETKDYKYSISPQEVIISGVGCSPK